MRFLFLGDIVGAPGVAAVVKHVPSLRLQESLDIVLANAENATNGAGLSRKDYKRLRACGLDALTLGDHIYKKFEIAEFLSSPDQPIVKPANFPASAPGKDHVVITSDQFQIALISLLGRTFMRPTDCPFDAVDRVLHRLDSSIKFIVVDIHAEATADKYLMAHYLDGRVSAIIGTHTHVPTADEQILPRGSAFICDVGMTGPYSGIIGRRADRVLHTARTFEPTMFDVATEDVRLAGVIVDVDDASGKALSIRRLMVNAEPAGQTS